MKVIIGNLNIHPLTYLMVKNNLKWKFEKCDKEYENGIYFYFFSSCKYYLREKCKQNEKPENFYQLLKIWNEHPLSFCFPIRGSISLF